MLILNVEDGPRLVFEALGLTDLFRYERETDPPESHVGTSEPMTAGATG
jgi:hypothetical protein